jgi:hypothetical protein
VDSDSQLFLNYLYLPIDGAEGIPADFRKDLESHRELILTRLKEFSANPGIWSKYAWAGAYHNYFCDRFIGDSKLMINPTLLSQPPRQLAEIYRQKGGKMYRGEEEVARFKHLWEWKVEREPE